MTNKLPASKIQWHSPEYVDSWFTERIEQACYQRFREKLASLLPFEPGATIRVLDIGTGDGALSLEVLHVYPNAEFVCHDFSETMLTRARQQLAQFIDRVTFVKSDLRDPAWTHVIKGTFDAVVSSIAIHNVSESSQGAPGRMQEIYSEVYGLVKPRGCFLNYDIVTPPGPVATEIYFKERCAVYQASLKAEMGIERSIQEIEQEFHERWHKWGGAPGIRHITNHLEWLKRAGFDEVDCLWIDMRNTIIGGFRH